MMISFLLNLREITSLTDWSFYFLFESQLKTEKSAIGLFEQLLQGSDRRPTHTR